MKLKPPKEKITEEKLTKACIRLLPKLMTQFPEVDWPNAITEACYLERGMEFVAKFLKENDLRPFGEIKK